MDNIIEISDLKKYYGDVKAVDGISFYVEKGKMFAFLGPNGAGKSTTIDMICTFLKPDSGTAIVDGNVLGKKDDAIRHIIGAVFQDGLLDNLLTIKENLETRGSLYGLKGKQLEEAVKKAAEAAGVTELMDRKYGVLSGGQRRRADIARALVNTPKILFLDEPTTGLDPQTRKNVWDTIKKLQQDTGMTVFLTTHYMEEAAEADYVIIIDNGKIAAKGTPADLKEKYSSDCLIMTIGRNNGDEEQIIKKLTQLGYEYKITANRINVKLAGTLNALPVLDVCKEYISGFEVITGTMDDAFISITGKEMR